MQVLVSCKEKGRGPTDERDTGGAARGGGGAAAAAGPRAVPAGALGGGQGVELGAGRGHDRALERAAATHGAALAGLLRGGRGDGSGAPVGRRGDAPTDAGAAR